MYFGLTEAVLIHREACIDKMRRDKTLLRDIIFGNWLPWLPVDKQMGSQKKKSLLKAFPEKGRTAKFDPIK
jgi:hypothetical protein